MVTYGRIATVITIFLSLAGYSFSQQYVINAYGDNDSTGYPRPLKTVFVDLETKSILGEIVFCNEGQIINKKAIPIAHNSDSLLINAAMAGCICDNGGSGITRLEVEIINPTVRSILHSFADSNLFLTSLEQLPDNKIYLEGETIKEPKQTINGDYLLDPAFKFIPRNNRPQNYSYGIYHGLGSFVTLRLLSDYNNLYRGIHNDSLYIIKTNNERTLIIDTLYLPTFYIIVDTSMGIQLRDRSHLISVIDTMLYDFNQNYESHTEGFIKEYRQGWIQSTVKIYNIRNFALVDSILIPDYPPGDYPDGVFDVADVVGPYIVYYYFGSEGLDIRAPAMLFIFDTRTNQATWLRVGWR